MTAMRKPHLSAEHASKLTCRMLGEGLHDWQLNIIMFMFTVAWTRHCPCHNSCSAFLRIMSLRVVAQVSMRRHDGTHKLSAWPVQHVATIWKQNELSKRGVIIFHLLKIMDKKLSTPPDFVLQCVYHVENMCVVL
jgi:hypothetical protein